MRPFLNGVQKLVHSVNKIFCWNSQYLKLFLDVSSSEKEEKSLADINSRGADNISLHWANLHSCSDDIIDMMSYLSRV